MDGYVRIKNLYLEGSCKDLSLKRIVAFLMKKPNMSEVYLKEEKNLKDMMKFICDNARKQASNNMACLTDEEVFTLAETYFTKSNEELGIKSVDDKKTKNNTKDETKENNQLSLGLECT